MTLAISRIEGAKQLKRNPSSSGAIDGAVAIELGDLLELQIGNQVIRAKRGTRLLWFPRWKALGFFEGVRWGRPSSSALVNLSEYTSTSKAENTFEKWAKREATKARTVTYPAGKRSWWSAGTAFRVDYRSDKWGKTDEYTHDFGKSVRANVLVHGKNTALWVISGGRLRVTSRGIEG